MPMRQTGMLSDTLILMANSERGRDGNKNCRPVRRTKKPCVPKGPGCLLVLVWSSVSSCLERRVVDVVVAVAAVDDDVVVVVGVVTPTTTRHAGTGGASVCNDAGVAVVSLWCISFREHG